MAISFQQTTISDNKKVTVVSIQAPLYDIAFVGTALCHPDDTFDADLGIELATSRALEHAAEFFKWVAWDKVPK